MSEQPKRFLCRHIHAAGHRCGSPCLRGEQFCYYHHTSRRPALPNRPAPGSYISPDRAFELPLLEDRAAVQLAIGEVARRIAANQLDPTRARLLAYVLQIASSNLPREPRNTAARGKSQPAPSNESSSEADLIDELILDPDLGPLAPELAEEEEDENQEEDVSHLTGIARTRKMLENINKRRAQDKCPVCHPDTWPQSKAEPQYQPDPKAHTSPKPEPATIPTIQATAVDTSAPAPHLALERWFHPLHCPTTYRAISPLSTSPSPALRRQHSLKLPPKAFTLRILDLKYGGVPPQSCNRHPSLQRLPTRPASPPILPWQTRQARSA